MTHSEVLASFGETIKGVTDRILATWAKATDSDKEAGATWYTDGEMIVDHLALQSGRSRETIAAVVAHLSPRTMWARNVMGATALVLTGKAPGCLSANVARAILALESDDPLATINGPKTGRFAANLLGDRSRVTIDVWAGRVALGEDADYVSIMRKPGVYDALEHCYRRAARRIGVDPSTMQATAWIVARNGRSN